MGFRPAGNRRSPRDLFMPRGCGTTPTGHSGPFGDSVWAGRKTTIRSGTRRSPRLFAALPLIVLFGAIGILQMRAHLAALLGLLVAMCLAVSVFGMPIRLALASVGFGAAYGLLPIGWIILNLIFLYQLTVKKGTFADLRQHLGFSGTGSTHSVDSDRVLVRSVFRGSRRIRNAGGDHGGHSDAARVLAAASVRSLVDCQHRTRRVRSARDTDRSALGCDGSSVALTVGDGGQTTALLLVDHSVLGRLGVCRIPRRSWVSGRRLSWPGRRSRRHSSLCSNYHGPWLVDIAGAIVSMGAVVLLLRVWQPRDPAFRMDLHGEGEQQNRRRCNERPIVAAWTPWLLLTAVIFVWGLPQTKTWLGSLSEPHYEVPYLHGSVVRAYPVVPPPTTESPTRPEDAVYKLSWLSGTGTGILLGGRTGRPVDAVLGAGNGTHLSGRPWSGCAIRC